MNSEQVKMLYDQGRISAAHAIRLNQDPNLDPYDPSHVKAEVETLADKFMADHPDYVNLYNDGSLDEFLQDGFSAREAYAEYHFNQPLSHQGRVKEALDLTNSIQEEENYEQAERVRLIEADGPITRENRNQKALQLVEAMEEENYTVYDEDEDAEPITLQNRNDKAVELLEGMGKTNF